MKFIAFIFLSLLTSPAWAQVIVGSASTPTSASQVGAVDAGVYLTDKTNSTTTIATKAAQSALEQTNAVVDKKTTYVSDIASLTALVRGNVTSVIVTDPVRGGEFVYKPTSYTIDNTVVFAAPGGGYFVRQFSGSIHGKWAGLVADNQRSSGTANQIAFANALSACANLGVKVLTMPAGKAYIRGGNYVINRALHGLTIEGQGKNDDLAWDGATSIYWINETPEVGGGIFFASWADDGLPQSAHFPADNTPDGNGGESVTFRNLNIVAASRSSSDLIDIPDAGRVKRQYVSGTTAFQDRRGGNFRFEHVNIVGWENGIWGYNSDFSGGYDLRIDGCKTGLHLAANSDQNNYTQTTFIGCERAIEVLNCWNIDFTSTNLISCGSTLRSAVYVGSTSDASYGDVGTVAFRGIWIEQNGEAARNGTGTARTIPTIFEIGAEVPTGPRKVMTLSLTDITAISMPKAGEDRRTNNLITVNGNIDNIRIMGLAPPDYFGQEIIKVNGPYSPYIYVEGKDVQKIRVKNAANNSRFKLVRIGPDLAGQTIIADGINGTHTVWNRNVDLNWRTAFQIKVGRGTYQGGQYDIVVDDAQNTWGSGATNPVGLSTRFRVSLSRSGAVEDNTNTAFLRGLSDDYIRVVTVQVGNGDIPAIFEIQTKNHRSYQFSHYRVQLIEIANTGCTVESFPDLPIATVSTPVTSFAIERGDYLSTPRNEHSIVGNGASTSYTIYRPTNFIFAIGETNGITVTAVPPNYCNAFTTYTITANIPAGRILYYTITTRP